MVGEGLGLPVSNADENRSKNDAGIDGCFVILGLDGFEGI